jgi:hypothetical protein
MFSPERSTLSSTKNKNNQCKHNKINFKIIKINQNYQSTLTQFGRN